MKRLEWPWINNHEWPWPWSSLKNNEGAMWWFMVVSVFFENQEWCEMSPHWPLSTPAENSRDILYFGLCSGESERIWILMIFFIIYCELHSDNDDLFLRRRHLSRRQTDTTIYGANRWSKRGEFTWFWSYCQMFRWGHSWYRGLAPQWILMAMEKSSWRHWKWRFVFEVMVPFPNDIPTAIRGHWWW